MNRIPALTGGRKTGMLQRPVRQGRRNVGARSVHGVREHDNGPRTPPAGFCSIRSAHCSQLRLHRRFAQFFHGQYFDLPDPFTRHVQNFPHFFECTGFPIVDAET